MKPVRFDWPIVFAVALGLAVGALADESAAIAGLPLAGLLDVLGTLFVSALKMLVVPLVTSSLIVGAAGVGSGASLGRLCLRTVSLFLVTSLSAIMVGMLLVNVARPGIVGGEPARELFTLESATTDMAEVFADQEIDDLLDVFLSIVPGNVFSAATGEDLLGLMFFSVLFGFFMARLDHSYADTMFRFWNGVSQVMMRVTGWVLGFAPLGVFALVARSAGRSGGEALMPVVSFVGIVLVAMAAHALITLPALLRFFTRVSPLALYRVALPVVLAAASTSSSLATLPMTMTRVERDAGVSGRISGLVLPLGVTVNLNGTALYNCAAATFLAQAYGVNLDLVSQLLILAVGSVASIGAGAQPAGSLLAIAIVLTTIGVPAEAVGVLFVVDRLLEVARTGLNVLGDVVCAVMVARINGEPTLVAAAGGSNADAI
jgi:Na+/H+-dicarboxylate symporter